MNNIMQKLESAIRNCRITATDRDGDLIDNAYLCAEALNVLNSLGENARLMFEIGVLQDNLVKLGAKMETRLDEDRTPRSLTGYIILFNEDLFGLPLPIYINFRPSCVEIVNQTLDRFYYTSPKWQQDVFEKVSELINETIMPRALSESVELAKRN